MKKENGDLKVKIKEVGVQLKNKEEEYNELVKALEISKSEVAALKVQLDGIKQNLEKELKEEKEKSGKEVSDLTTRLESLKTVMSEFQLKANQITILFEKFSDPVTKEKHKCPVVQTNGVIRSLTEIIKIWLREADLGPSNAFRMYQCPVLGGFSMIAPFQIIQNYMTLASAVGINVDLPVKFSYKQEKDGSVWVDFPFHEQLELIARFCSVYSHRRNQARPPEQRNVSIGDLSFMIVMTAVACGTGFKMDFNVYNNSDGKGGRILVKVIFEAGWHHPFDDMGFSVDA
jgi:hypothetical protein